MAVARSVLFTCVLLAAAIFVVDIILPLGVAAAVPYIAVILIALSSGEKKFILQMAVFTTCLTVVGGLLSPFGGEIWKVVANRIIAIFSILATTFLALKREKDQAANLEANRQKLIAGERQKTYEACIYASQHIVNNMLNQLMLIEHHLKQNRVDKEDARVMSQILIEAKELMNKLSSVSEVEPEAIKKSIAP